MATIYSWNDSDSTIPLQFRPSEYLLGTTKNLSNVVISSQTNIWTKKSHKQRLLQSMRFISSGYLFGIKLDIKKTDKKNKHHAYKRKLHKHNEFNC